MQVGHSAWAHPHGSVASGLLGCYLRTWAAMPITTRPAGPACRRYAWAAHARTLLGHARRIVGHDLWPRARPAPAWAALPA